jgi:outer membrane biosynthesis protein TonB
MWRKSMRIISLFLLAFFLMMPGSVQAQDPEVAFHSGAKAYIGGDVPLAKRIVNDALRYSPSDPKLNELRRKLEEKEKQNQDQQNKDQENQDKGEKTEEDSEDQQKQDQKPENGDLESQDKPSEDPDESQDDQMVAEPKRVEDQKISKEKAMMILEAMRNNEIQYIQQQRKKTQQRPPDNRPDW